MVDAIKISLSAPPLQHHVHSDVKRHRASLMKNLSRHISLYSIAPGVRGAEEKERFYSALYLKFGPFNVIVCRLIVADVHTFTYSTLYSKSSKTSKEADLVQGRWEGNAEDTIENEDPRS